MRDLLDLGPEERRVAERAGVDDDGHHVVDDGVRAARRPGGRRSRRSVPHPAARTSARGPSPCDRRERKQCTRRLVEHDGGVARREARVRRSGSRRRPARPCSWRRAPCPSRCGWSPCRARSASPRRPARRRRTDSCRSARRCRRTAPRARRRADHVDEMHRHVVRLEALLGPGADPAEMVRIAQRDRQGRVSRRLLVPAAIACVPIVSAVPICPSRLRIEPRSGTGS